MAHPQAQAPAKKITEDGTKHLFADYVNFAMHQNGGLRLDFGAETVTDANAVALQAIIHMKPSMIPGFIAGVAGLAKHLNIKFEPPAG